MTTPMQLVTDTITATLCKNRLNSMTVNDILSITMLDPACGSGVFLAGMYDYLEGAVISKIKEDPPLLAKSIIK